MTSHTDQSQPSAVVWTCQLNGQTVKACPGETILEVTRRSSGHHVPTLCYDPKLDPFGACRVCMVEIEGRPKPVAACHTPVADGMVIHTESPRLERLRRMTVELLMSDLPADLFDRRHFGHNEFHAVVRQTKASSSRFPAGAQKIDSLTALPGQPPGFNTDHPYLGLDLDSCIVCSRCVRACDEVQGTFALTIQGRGFDSVAVPGAYGDFNASDCVSCGACAYTCPTGAIFDKGFLEFPDQRVDREVRTTCSYCGVGCGFLVQVKNNRAIAVKPADQAASSHGHLCLKGRFAFQYAQSDDRLTTPLLRNPESGVLEPATWEDAVAYVARRLTAIREAHGPEAIAGISSARCTNEENFLMQKFIRSVIGGNNIDCCARVCHSPTAFGMRTTFGTGAATNSFDDIDLAKLLMIVGANPTHGHPVVGARMKQAVLDGAKLIVIDPRATELAQMADVHLALKPGTNVPLFNALAHVIVTEGLCDEEFIANCTEGWEDYRAFIADKSPEWAAPICGVDAEGIRRAARLYATSGGSMMFHGLGVTEHYQGSFGVMLLANLAMLTGNVGRPGVGVNPLRGQNNVQGAADMGAMPDLVTGYQPLTQPEVLATIQDLWGTELNPHKGLTIPDMFDAAIAGRLKALWLVGEDVVQTDPNSAHVIRAMEQLDLLIVQEIFLTETAKYAHVVLPGASFLEKQGTFTNSERRVQLIRKVIDSPGEARPDWQITQAVANAMGANWQYESPDDILEEIAAIWPAWRGLLPERLRAGEGLQWPVPHAEHPGTPIVHEEGRFSRGRGHLVTADYVPTEEAVTTDFPFLLTTGRLLEHYNSGTMTRRTNNTLLITRDLLELHPEDAARLGVGEGDYVRLRSRRGAVEVAVDVTSRVNPGTLFLTFHFPDVLINLLTSNVREINTKCPEYKVVAVAVEPLTPAEQAQATQAWLKRVGQDQAAMEHARLLRETPRSVPLPVAE